jgi:hypothetical protein
VGEFGIFLLQGNYSGADILGVSPGSLPRQATPLLTTQDILRYDLATHEIQLTRSAYQRFMARFPTPVKTDGIPFVVTVGEEAVYAGALWTPLSSLSFDGVTILQPIDSSGDSIRIELGYPGSGFFTRLDPRSDPRIIRALRAAGKLQP